MILLGITGPIGHGKSTLADDLTATEPSSLHLESSRLISKVADKLHAATATIPDPDSIDSLNEWIGHLSGILKEVVHLDCSEELIHIDKSHLKNRPEEYEKLLVHVRALQADPTLREQTINPENKETYRPLLQWLGGYLAKKVDSGIWYNELVRQAQQAGAKGTKLVVIGGVRYPIEANIIREAGGSVVKIYRPDFEQADLLDPTERERDNIQVDSTIINDGSLEQLRQCAGILLEDVRNKQLQGRYQVKEI